MKDAVAWARAFVQIDKSSALTLEGDTAPIATRRDAMELVKQDTGLQLGSRGAARLGNIEILAPSADPQSRSPVQLRSGDGTLGVYLNKADLPANAALTVRARLKLADHTVTDTLAPATGTEGLIAEFSSDTNFDSYLVQVFAQVDEGRRPELWYEHHVALIKRIAGDIRMITGSMDVHAPWLRRQSARKGGAKKASGRVREIESVERHHSTPVQVRADEEKTAALEKALESARSLLPHRRNADQGGVFQSGWAGEGKLAFFHWFREVAKRAGRGRVLLVDPYFDDAALELLIRVTNSSAHYRVLLDSREREISVAHTKDSQDDEGSDEATSAPKRADRLRQQLERWAPLAEGLDVEVRDMRAAPRKAKRPLHDRLLLVYDEHGQVTEGFNLSNSIQSATRRTPLLVTPIGSEVLPDVDNYLSELWDDVAKPEDGQDSALWSPATARRRRQQSRPRPSFDDLVPGFRVLAGLDVIDPALVRDEMVKIGVGIVGDVDKVHLAEVPTEDLESLPARLVALTDSDFAVAWTALGEILARASSADKVVSILATLSTAGLLNRLHEFLRGAVKAQVGAGVAGLVPSRELLSLAQRATGEFRQAVESAGNLHRFSGHETFAGPWACQYAIKVLIAAKPELLSDLVRELQDRIRGGYELDSAERMADAFLLGMVVGAVVSTTFFRAADDEVSQRFLTNEIPLFRALAAQSFLVPFSDGLVAAPASLSALGTLPPEEQIWASADAAYHLRENDNEHRRPGDAGQARGAGPRGRLDRDGADLVS